MILTLVNANGYKTVVNIVNCEDMQPGLFFRRKLRSTFHTDSF